MHQNKLRRYSPLADGGGQTTATSSEEAGAESGTESKTQLESVQLFLLPFAGANRNSYRGLEVALQAKGIQTTTLELPGHGARGSEPLLSDLHDMEEDLYKQLAPHIKKPYVLFGHSMGSLLAYRLSQRFVRENLSPHCLIVSGRAAPCVPLRRNRIHALPQDAFFEEVRRLGGSPEAILQNRELMEYFEPILRADFRAVEMYQHIAESPLPIPVSVILGVHDTVSQEDVQRWDEHVSDKIQLTMMPGGHFYLLEKPDETAQIIRHSILAAL